MKIAIYAICKNEANHIDRWLESAKAADVIVMADTGSTDGTEKRATHHLNIQPFRFDDARNAALALIPADVDVCIALDLDETLEPGWREAFERAPMFMAGGGDPVWSAWIDFNFNGEVFRQNNRVHSRHGWRWKHPCHEALVPSMQRNPSAIETAGFTITHRPDLTKPRPNYLELLAWGQWEDPKSLRMLHYYGRELMFQGYPKDAAERFKQYLKLHDGPEWSEVRQTREYLTKCIAAA